MVRPKRLAISLLASSAVDLLVLALLISASRAPRSQPARSFDIPVRGIVWLSEPGHGGGGGGGGNKMTEPPRKAERPGQDALTVAVVKRTAFEQRDTPEPNVVDQLNIPAKDLASGIDLLTGAIDAPPGLPTTSQGPGSNGGSGSGNGTGDGPGTGPGLGPGRDGGTGDGVYRVGNDVTSPVAIRQVRPNYTSDAMRARVQGPVLLECIVTPDGSCSDIKVLQSLDPVFGLDVEAIKAARQWRFQPGMRRGLPVSVSVKIELDFRLR
jgi:periplasmic protein TonB